MRKRIYSRQGTSHLGPRGSRRSKKKPLNERELAELRLFNAENEMVQQLRDYYRENFQNGRANESFLLWIEGKMKDGHVK